MKNKIVLLVILFFSTTLKLFAQQSVDAKRDYQWLFGYRYSGNIYSNLMDFNAKPAKISPVTTKMFDIEETLGQICTKDGKLLLYSLGCDIRDSSHNIIMNGDSLSYGSLWNLFCPDKNGFTLPQGLIILPKPSNPDKYLIFHITTPEKIKSYAAKMMYSEVDMQQNNGKGLVTIKNKTIIDDTLTYSNMSAVRHGNGRDWWVMIPEKSEDESNSHYYYATLVTSS